MDVGRYFSTQSRAAAHGYLCRVGGVLGWRLLTWRAFPVQRLRGDSAARAGKKSPTGLRKCVACPMGAGR